MKSTSLGLKLYLNEYKRQLNCLQVGISLGKTSGMFQILLSKDSNKLAGKELGLVFILNNCTANALGTGIGSPSLSIAVVNKGIECQDDGGRWRDVVMTGNYLANSLVCRRSKNGGNACGTLPVGVARLWDALALRPIFRGSRNYGHLYKLKISGRRGAPPAPEAPAVYDSPESLHSSGGIFGWLQ
ncbi:hypothetical protein GlitD10_0868 [Gloeomargarita lithophora Alchichica-D10]|uniref:Uncharacterized protein n=1 Tax=Gloeomargarita lithophora Alchichica-D10 TaxID=1188229 RepID=A0A1J0AB70_9CYAN|nr:hypothetical protein [Gloeomargarita lithophora]APB33184.1 hypothetical protein GlitD10_0868 [Gloeomargarita lithophora Alchichica-D10]